MKNTVTITALAALAGLSSALPASAQDRPPVPPAKGMIHTGDGWRQPTVRDALEALARQASLYDPAVAILRQAFGPRPAAELAGLADRLAEMVADTTLPRDVRNNASSALTVSASDAYNAGGMPHPYDDGGTPYPQAFDILVRVYEGGIDEELYSILAADPERGPAYVRNLFEQSERPALCFRGHYRGPGDPPECVGDPRDTPWCRAGGVLYGDIVDEATHRMWPRGVPIVAGDPLPVPDGLPKHVGGLAVARPLLRLAWGRAPSDPGFRPPQGPQPTAAPSWPTYPARRDPHGSASRELGRDREGLGIRP